MDANALIASATRLLDKNGLTDVPDHKLREADTRARIATAAALNQIAQALNHIAHTSDTSVRPAIRHSA